MADGACRALVDMLFGVYSSCSGHPYGARNCRRCDAGHLCRNPGPGLCRKYSGSAAGPVRTAHPAPLYGLFIERFRSCPASLLLCRSGAGGCRRCCWNCRPARRPGWSSHWASAQTPVHHGTAAGSRRARFSVRPLYPGQWRYITGGELIRRKPGSTQCRKSGSSRELYLSQLHLWQRPGSPPYRVWR
ncbi:hypothetical protein D3C74_321920 [compost metagenome]